MRQISFGELAHTDVFFGCPEVFPESWATRHSFSLYRDTPRPCAALFFVKTDIQVSFFPQNGSAVTATKGAVVYIPTGVCYHVEVQGGSSGTIDTYTVNHRLLDDHGEEILLNDAITVLCKRGEGRLELYFQKLDETVHRTAEGTVEDLLAARAAFYGLLSATVAAGADQNQSYYAIRQGVEALRRDWNRNERIEVYAELCGVTPAYFYRCFRKWAGQSPVEYRNALRLSHAQAMLRNTDMQIREIAETVGFEDPFYFCRVFSKQFGQSPRQYRHSPEG